MSTAQVEEAIADGQVTEGGNQFLTFLLAGEEYGVDILRVQEIRGWDAPTKIPSTPGYVRGVINIRGSIIPIIDLRERLRLETIEYTNETVVVVLRIIAADGKDRTMGLVVDAVSDVYNVSESDTKPAPDFGGGVESEFARNLATVGDKMVIILDVDQLMNGDLADADFMAEADA